MPSGSFGRRVRRLLRPVVIASALAGLSLFFPGCELFYSLVLFSSQIGEDGLLVKLPGSRTALTTEENALVEASAACASVTDLSTGTSESGCDLGFLATADVDQAVVINDVSVNGNTAAIASRSGVLAIKLSDGATAKLGIPTDENVTRALVTSDEKEVIVAAQKVYRCNLQTPGSCVRIPGIPDNPGTAVGLVQTPTGNIYAAFEQGGIFKLPALEQAFTPVPWPPGVRITDAKVFDGKLLVATENNGVVGIPEGGGGSFQLTTGIIGPWTATAIAGSYPFLNVAGWNGNAFVISSSNGGGSWGPLVPITSQGVAVKEINWEVFAPVLGVGATNAIRSLADPPPALFAGTNAGVFRSTDNGATWAPFNQGVATATVTRVLVTPERVYAGTFYNANSVYRSSEDGLTFSPGNSALVNQATRALAAVGDNVVASGETGIFRSTDGGATWVKGVAGLPAGTYFFGMITLGANMLGGSVYLNATSPGGVYRSTDSGATWTRTSQGLPVNINVTTFASSGGLVVAQVTTSSARAIYRSTDGGLTWSKGAEFAQGSPVALSFSGATLYAGLTGTASEHLYKSTDGGLTFTPSGSGLANRQVLSLASSGDTLFAGTYTGLYASTDGGASWNLFTKRLAGISVFSLATTASRVYAGTIGASLRIFDLPQRVRRLVPIVLDVDTGATRFTTELVLTNASAKPLDVSLSYTASIGSGTGTVHEQLQAGEQKVIPDAISYLRGKGVAIPSSGSQGGTLLVTFEGASDSSLVAVTARTSAATLAPQPVGSAGLAYGGVDPAAGFTGSVIVYGLRSNGTERSNFAVYNTTSLPVTLKVTAISGSGDGSQAVIANAETLPAYGWKQYNGILAGVGMTNGYVKVERTSATGAFGAYGVVNDNGTNDGSFLEPTQGFLVPYVNVPVLVETSAFLSELLLANSGASEAVLELSYRESLAPSGGGGTVTVRLPAGAQMIVPSALEYLRSLGVAIGARGAGGYAGSLHVAVTGTAIENVFAGARTASLSPAAGQFGLFTPGIFAGGETLLKASIFGLRSDQANRSNVAAANTGTSAGSGSITLELQAYDGDAGGVPRGTPAVVDLQPGQWTQMSNFLSTKGVANGWVVVTKTAGNAPFLAYGVINDGGSPGQRTGDGAYVPMSR
ncbi:MAG: glycoside hydrolase [Thermoanaerobaculia bacterium]|nr:glycoside hydrolase [Thermoanaerobaculia bacterium]